MDVISKKHKYGLRGTIEIPSDKSVSHRAAIISMLTGESNCTITNYSKGADCHSTLNVIRELGCNIRFVGEKDFSSLRKYFHDGLNSLFFLAFYLTMFILLFSQDIVMVLFQRGNFDSAATLMVSEALFFITLSIIPYMARDTITRIFYAFNDSKTPFLVALSSVVLKLVLNALLIEKLGIGAITLSTSFVTLFNGAVLGFLLRKKIKLYYGKYFKQLSKMLVSALATAIIAGIVYLVWYIDRTNSLALLFKTTTMLFLIFGLYLIFGIRYKVDYILILRERLRRKIDGYLGR